MHSFGQRLRAAREAIGFTQEKLGFEVGVSKASISAWEHDRERPSFENLPKLHLALNESLDDLVLGFAEARMQVNAIRGIMEAHASYHGEPNMAASKNEAAILKRFRKLTAKKQLAVLELLKPEP